MNTDTRIRARINILLSDKPDAFDAFGCLTSWKKTREAAYHLTRAIRLYAALLKGDSALLQEFFPQFGVFVASPRPKTAIAPAPVVQRNETEELADLLDVFGEELEF